MVMKKLNELTCKELIAELKTRGISSSGPKAELTARLEEALRAEGLDPNEVTFDELSDGGKSSEEGGEKSSDDKMAAMFSSLTETIKTLSIQTNERIDSTSKQTIEIVNKQTADVVNDRTNEMKEAFTSEIGETNNRVLELQSGLEAKIKMFQVEMDKIKEDVRLIKQDMNNRVKRIENQLASSSFPESVNPIKFEPPVYDGQTAWQIFKRQFEAVCACNMWSASEKTTALMLALRGPAADLIQTLSLNSPVTYDELVRTLERRFGDEHMQPMYPIATRNS
ncbi:hypothetical protein M8J77_020215 [Diaphorina citri]|nr:hypothetical protein M8J77_020215 [Diaphorina citri]